MGGLRGVPEEIAGFGVEAVDFALEATGDAASDPVDVLKEAGSSASESLGGLNTSVDVEGTIAGVDRRVVAGLAIVAIVAVAWGGS